MKRLVLLLAFLPVFACAGAQKPTTATSGPVVTEKILTLPGSAYVVALTLQDADKWRAVVSATTADAAKIVLTNDLNGAVIAITTQRTDNDDILADIGSLTARARDANFDVLPCAETWFGISAHGWNQAACAEKRHHFNRALEGREVMLRFPQAPNVLVTVSGNWTHGDVATSCTVNTLFLSAEPVRATVLRQTR